MASFPVLSNMLGVIHGYAAKLLTRTWTALRAHLKQEPPTEVDTTDFLGSVRKAGSEGEDSPRKGKCYKHRGKERLH